MKKQNAILSFLLTASIVLFTTQALAIVVDANVILKGAYDINDGMMRDDLRIQNVLPLLEPYTGYGYAIDNAGTTADPSVFAVSGSDAIVDWVVVELRSEADASVVVERRVALLQRDGDIVNSQGNTPQFAASAGKYHILVDYKNHLPLMSLRALDGTGGTINFDFTDLNTQIFADDTHSGADEIDGKRALRPGDTTGDSIVSYVGTDNDRDLILNFIQNCDESLVFPMQNGQRNQKIDEEQTLIQKEEKKKVVKNQDRNERAKETFNKKEEDQGSEKLGGGSIPTYTCNGYYRADINADGIVKYAGSNNDRDLILLAIGGLIPTNTVVARLPENNTDTTLPSNPIPAIASIDSLTSIDLSWAASTDTDYGLAGYIVYRDGVEIAYVEAGTLDYLDTNVVAGPTYYYDVYALDFGLNESALAGSDNTATGVAPTAADDTLPNVTEGQSVSFNLFDNDTLEGATMSNAPNPNPSIGDFNPVDTNTGDVTFNAYAGSAGTHTFSYEIQNGFGSSTANITVTIDPAVTNQAPVAVSDNLSTQTNTNLPIVPADLTTNDQDDTTPSALLEIEWVGNDVNGQVVSNGNPITSLTFIPDNNFDGMASFEYRVRDTGNLISNNAVVYVDVQNHGQTTITVNNVSGIGEELSVQLHTTVDASTPSITIRWADVTGRDEYSADIYRKSMDDNDWGNAIATNVAGANYSYTDFNVNLGEVYEYRVDLDVAYNNGNDTGTAQGYIAAGVQADVAKTRGRIIVLVDGDIEGDIETELKELQRDLYGDGWIPMVHSVPSSTSPSSLRTTLVEDYYEATVDPNDPNSALKYPNINALYLLGHIPSMYSGNNDPDGHEDDRAFSTDLYYARQTDTWTQYNGTCNSSGGLDGDALSNGNLMCQRDIPGQILLQTGRVDMRSMSSFNYLGDEAEKTKHYLNKAHNFKHKNWEANKRTYLDGFDSDHWRDTQNYWASTASIVGPTNIEENTSSLIYNHLNNNNYMFAYLGKGGAGCTSFLSGELATSNLANTNWGGVFNEMLGSYVGESNCANSLLRGLLLSGDGLTSVYSSQKWFYHQMGMAQTIGFSAMKTMNNKVNQNYFPINIDWDSYHDPGGGLNMHDWYHNIHMKLFGDPSLRAEYIKGPSNVNASGGNVTWSASPESGTIQYHVFRITLDVDDEVTEMQRLTTSPVSGTSYATSTNAPGSDSYEFMVQAVKLVTTPSGSLYLPSIGAVTNDLVP